jgi:hypothetical protein
MKANVQTIVSKEIVLASCKDVIEKYSINAQGTLKLNATECYGLVLACVVAEMEESCEADLTEVDGDLIQAEAEVVSAQRRTVFMFTWSHFPKNPSAFRQAFFGKDSETTVVSLEEKYSF